jgi:hypothetical protein
MEERPAWQRKSGGRMLVKRASKDGLHGKRVGLQDFAFAINVAQKQFKGLEALGERAGNYFPLHFGENLREKVAEPGTAPPGAVPGNIKGDAHFPHRGFQSFIKGFDAIFRERIQPFDKGTVDLPREAVTSVRLVPMRKSGFFLMQHSP